MAKATRTPTDRKGSLQSLIEALQNRRDSTIKKKQITAERLTKAYGKVNQYFFYRHREVLKIVGFHGLDTFLSPEHARSEKLTRGRLELTLMDRPPSESLKQLKDGYAQSERRSDKIRAIQEKAGISGLGWKRFKVSERFSWLEELPGLELTESDQIKLRDAAPSIVANFSEGAKELGWAIWAAHEFQDKWLPVSFDRLALLARTDSGLIKATISGDSQTLQLDLERTDGSSPRFFATQGAQPYFRPRSASFQKLSDGFRS